MYVKVLCLCIVVVYLGQVLGLMTLCENYSFLKPALKLAFSVPFMRIVLFCVFLSDSIRSHSYKQFLSFLKLREKSVIILGGYARILQDERKNQQICRATVKRRNITPKAVKSLLLASL